MRTTPPPPFSWHTVHTAALISHIFGAGPTPRLTLETAASRHCRRWLHSWQR